VLVSSSLVSSSLKGLMLFIIDDNKISSDGDSPQTSQYCPVTENIVVLKICCRTENLLGFLK